MTDDKTLASPSEQLPTEDIESVAVASEEPDTPAEEAAECPSEGDAHPEGEPDTDYERMISEDLAELRLRFPELRGVKDITELENPLRYAALRDLGLSPKEAYLATSEGRRSADGRAHLTSAAPRAAGSPRGGIPAEELGSMRELFSGMSDGELAALYRKVSG